MPLVWSVLGPLSWTVSGCSVFWWRVFPTSSLPKKTRCAHRACAMSKTPSNWAVRYPAQCGTHPYRPGIHPNVPIDASKAETPHRTLQLRMPHDQLPGVPRSAVMVRPPPMIRCAFVMLKKMTTFQAAQSSVLGITWRPCCCPPVAARKVRESTEHSIPRPHLTPQQPPHAVAVPTTHWRRPMPRFQQLWKQAPGLLGQGIVVCAKRRESGGGGVASQDGDARTLHHGTARQIACNQMQSASSPLMIVGECVRAPVYCTRHSVGDKEQGTGP